MKINSTSTVKIASDGLWQGDHPLDCVLPLLAVQISIILLITHGLAFILKPLRQPRVVAEILGGIVLGPSVLGRWEAFRRTLFLEWSLAVLDAVAGLGLLLFLFLVGLELDLRSIRRAGRRATAIAVAGIVLPFVAALGIVPLLNVAVPAPRATFLPLAIFLGAALSVTALAVLACILAELGLLDAPFSETAMAAAAVNDVAAWVLLALALAISSGGGHAHKSPLIPLYILVSGAAYAACMLYVLRPIMAFMARRFNNHAEAQHVGVCFVLVGALLAGVVADAIGVHAVLGAFVFGLCVPREGGHAARAGERIEGLVSGLMLPVYFAASGLRTDVGAVQGAAAWGMVVLVVFVALAGKFAGTFAVAVGTGMAAREAAALGVAMGTKGLVELIVLNIGKERKVLDDTTFAIFVLMALTTTFITTPVMTVIYRPPATTTTTTTQPGEDLDEQNMANICMA